MRKPIIDGEVTYIPLTQGESAIIDTCELDVVDGVRWHVIRSPNTNYAGTAFTENGKRKTVRMHRILMGDPEGKEIDHINGNGLDNRLANLRVVDRSKNGMNRRKQKNNKSGYKGVYLDKDSGKWRAVIKAYGKVINLGSFSSKEDAHQAYCEASKKYHGEFGRTE